VDGKFFWRGSGGFRAARVVWGLAATLLAGRPEADSAEGGSKSEVRRQESGAEGGGQMPEVGYRIPDAGARVAFQTAGFFRRLFVFPPLWPGRFFESLSFG